jgi:16S rRNA (cytidine1402-2'-O)-methyltransferase
MPGTLFVVATPIGNLEDLTFRALRILGEVDLIAAEDTRRTSKLLAHYKIRRPLASLREHNEARESERLLHQLAQGRSIALVSDAGTPGIADPGARLVRLARQRGISVVPLPGPTAIAAALSASGLPADQFVFLGFPPASGERRHEWFDALQDESRTVVFFEAPHRIGKLVADLEPIAVNRPIMLFRELTKINEELVIQPIKSTDVSDLGEFTVIIGPPKSGDEPPMTIADDTVIGDMIGHLTKLSSIDNEMAITMVAAALGLRPAKIRKALRRMMFSVKRQSDSGPP